MTTDHPNRSHLRVLLLVASACALVSCLIAATIDLFRKTSLPGSSSRDANATIAPASFAASDAESLFRSRGAVLYDTSCLSQHSRFIADQEKRLRESAAPRGLTDDAISGFVMAASDAVSADSVNDLRNLAWIPPTDALLSRPGSCDDYPRRDSEAASLLYYAVTDGSDDLAVLCVRNAPDGAVDAAGDRYNLLMVSSSRGLDGTFRELVKRGADPFYRSNYTTAGILAQDPGGYSSVPLGATSWLTLAASVRTPNRAYLAGWIERHAGEISIAPAAPTPERIKSGLDLGLQLVREVPVDDDDRTERVATLSRLFGCMESDLLFVGADAESHPGLFVPLLERMRPVDAALAGGCYRSLDVLSTVHPDGRDGVDRDLLEPCPPMPTPISTALARGLGCHGVIGFKQEGGYIQDEDRFYCQTGPASAPAEALDLLLLREEIKYLRSYSQHLDDRDASAVRVLGALQKGRRPFATRRLALADILAIAACGLYLPRTTLHLLDANQVELFGSLSRTWSEEEFNFTDANEAPQGDHYVNSAPHLSMNVTPSLVLQCLLQTHPASDYRDRAERILRNSYGAAPLRPDKLPLDPHHLDLFDALRTNLTAAQLLLEATPAPLEPEDLKDPDYGTGANAFHAFFSNYRTVNWCDMDLNNTEKWKFGNAPRDQRPTAERIWELLGPLDRTDLIQEAIEVPAMDRNDSPRTPIASSRVGCQRGEFCYDRNPEQQCVFLSPRMILNSTFGRTDVVLESMALNLRKALRDWMKWMNGPPVTHSYHLSVETGATNALTPLTFALDRYAALQDWNYNCDTIQSMILRLAKEGVGLCSGGGNYFDWILFGEYAKKLRNPRLFLDILIGNPSSFCCAMSEDTYQRYNDPSEYVLQILKSNSQHDSDSARLFSYLVRNYSVLCGGNRYQQESAAAFAAQIAARTFRPSTMSAGRDHVTQVEVFGRVDKGIFGASFGALNDTEKGEALSKICIEERDLSSYDTKRMSFASLAIQAGFACRLVAETVARVERAAMDEPVADCGEDMVPFWVALKRDLEISRVEQQFAISRLQLSAKNGTTCPWGHEGEFAKVLLDRSGFSPLNESLVVAWASARGFVEILAEISETAWTMDAVKDGIRERNTDWISAVPNLAQKWLLDREVVSVVTKLPVLRASKIYDATGKNITDVVDRHWVRVYELLDSVADVVNPEDDILEWLYAVAASRDFFPVVDTSNRKNYFDEIRRREIRQAAETFSKHLFLNNRSKDELDRLLIFASSNWGDKFFTDVLRDPPEDPESVLMLNALLEAGADPNTTIAGEESSWGAVSVLNFAISSEAVFLRLWEAGSRPSNPTDMLCLVLFGGKAKIAERLLEVVDISAPSYVYKGLTPLHCAACSISPLQYSLIDAVIGKGGKKDSVANFTGRDSEYGNQIRGQNVRPVDMYDDKELCEAVFGSAVWDGQQPHIDEIHH